MAAMVFGGDIIFDNRIKGRETENLNGLLAGWFLTG
jgi:hypothetical protein